MTAEFNLPIGLPKLEVERLQKMVQNITPKELARGIRSLSDFYIENPERPTPWDREDCLIAYWAYFHPRNFIRNLAVLRRCAQVNFFTDTTAIHDFGSGLGAASRAYFSFFGKVPTVAYEISEIARLRSKLVEDLGACFQFSPAPKSENDLLICSYSLTELPELPQWAFQFSRILIVEPSLKKNSQRLIRWRSQFLAQGYYVWAPCTHQENCPLTSTRSDWCHDRIHWKVPEWLEKIQELLPMDFATLPFSYLALQKTPPKSLSLARVIGDPLVEKGKTRQMICRSENREFIAWLHRDHKGPYRTRGEQIESPIGRVRGNEIRLLC